MKYGLQLYFFVLVYKIILKSICYMTLKKADIFNILFSDCNKFIIITSNQKFLWEISY